MFFKPAKIFFAVAVFGAFTFSFGFNLPKVFAVRTANFRNLFRIPFLHHKKSRRQASVRPASRQEPRFTRGVLPASARERDSPRITPTAHRAVGCRKFRGLRPRTFGICFESLFLHHKKSRRQAVFFVVIQRGFEPRTPCLKGAKYIVKTS